MSRRLRTIRGVPGYRPPSREPRGKWAKAIHAKRRRDGISQVGGFELLGPRLGLGPKSRQSYVNLDMGDRQPSEAEAAILAEWLGGYPVESSPASETVTVPEAGAYLTRMDALVGAVTELVAELRAARQDQDDLRERVEALEAAAKLQARPVVGASGTPRTPGRIGESA